MDLESRLRKLERTNRVLSAVAGLGIVAALAGAVSKTDVVQATRFEVVDDKGHVRGALEYAGGCARLRLDDATRNTRAWIGMEPNGTMSISAASRDAESYVGIMVPNDADPYLGIKGRDGHTRFIEP